MVRPAVTTGVVTAVACVRVAIRARKRVSVSTPRAMGGNADPTGVEVPVANVDAEKSVRQGCQPNCLAVNANLLPAMVGSAGSMAVVVFVVLVM